MSANLFATLPFLPSNGPGAPVDVSAMGATKTIVVGGTFQATVTIEYSTAPSGNLWAPAGSFNNPGSLVVDLAVQRMRAVTSGFVSGAADVSVGAPASPSAAVQLTGAPLDVSALPPFKTVVVDGACNVELSEDGVSYSQVFSFAGPGGQSGSYAAQFARVSGGATCWMGGAGQGGSGSIIDTAVAFCSPNPGVRVDIVAQSGQFVAPGTYVGVGVYSIDMAPIPGVTAATQLFPQATANISAEAVMTATPSFSSGHGVIEVQCFSAGLPADAPFYLNVAITG